MISTESIVKKCINEMPAKPKILLNKSRHHLIIAFWLLLYFGDSLPISLIINLLKLITILPEGEIVSGKRSFRNIN
jgi:hypothetical protein